MKKISTNLTIIIVAALLLVTVLLYTTYQNNQLKAQLLQQQIQTSIPAPRPPVQRPIFPDSIRQPIPQSPQLTHHKTIEELKTELASEEALHFSSYVGIVKQSFKPNSILIQKPDLFHHSVYSTDGYMATGVIVSRASIVHFENFVIDIYCYSQTAALIDTREFTVYEVVNPSGNITFSQKIYPPDGTFKVDFKLVRVTPY